MNADRIFPPMKLGTRPETAIEMFDDVLDVMILVIAANREFQSTMTGDWGGDPLQDAITTAEELLTERFGKEWLEQRLAG